MEKFVIHGQRRLAGELIVAGAKNHALKLIPAAFLYKNPVVLCSVPQVEDVNCLLEIVRKIGGLVKLRRDDYLEITSPKRFSGQLPRELVAKLRASLVLTGPLLTRYGQVELPHPGGCLIGKRPIDFFVAGFRAMGAKVQIISGQKRNRYIFSAPDGLSGATICFPHASVTATETLMMAATLAKGRTVLINAALEPEVSALAKYLNAGGAKISGIGTTTLTIQGSGGKLLQSANAAQVIPDRIEAGSFVILAAATNSHIVVKQCAPQHLAVLLEFLQQIGVKLTVTKDSITVWPSIKSPKLQATSIVTHEYPGFPTDLQAPITVLLTQAHGQSQVRETIYENRLAYITALNKMGAQITMRDSFSILISGGSKLYGTTVESPDIRAGIAMVIAGLLAEGKTTIKNIYQIDRGYEHLEQKLQKIGVAIERVASH